MTRRSIVAVLAFLPAACVSVCPSAAAKEDIEFVQEHLPEVAMDNRYATLPIWGAAEEGKERPVVLESGWSDTTVGNLSLSGPLLSIGAAWRAGEHWQLGGLAFYDPLELRAEREVRDLQTLFAPETPIARPVSTEFTSLDGTALDWGVGLYAVRRFDSGFLGAHRWIGGVLWQSVELEGYRFDYRILEGPQQGVTGQIDFDANYRHITPFLGLELPRSYRVWATNMHVLLARPMPRRGVVGHITGPGFDIHGDTADVGNGKHFGDPSLTFGYTVTYLPARLSVDLGTLLSQALLEPRVHRGIERDLVLSFSVSF